MMLVGDESNITGLQIDNCDSYYNFSIIKNWFSSDNSSSSESESELSDMAESWTLL